MAKEQPKRLPFELDIPGIPGYTIDPDMQVRSYLSGIPFQLKVKTDHTGCFSVNVWVVNDLGIRKRKTFSLLRLWLCAKAGVSPLDHTVDSFTTELGGEVTVRQRKQHNVVTSTRVTQPEDVQKRLLVQSKTITDAQLRAIESGDWSEVLTLMEDYREVVVAIASARYRVSNARSEALYREAAHRLYKLMSQYKRPIYTVQNSLLKQIRQMILRGEEV